jgi:Flp pilus assembly protein TadG
MTRAVVFLAVAMVAASLGLVAQDTSGTQNSTQDNSAQHAVAGATNSSQDANSASPAVLNQKDPAKSTVTRDSSDPKSAGGQVNPGTDNGQLPQTSTILPLLGLIGLGSLVAGFFARH